MGRAVSEATITLDGRSTTVALPRDTTVLEGAQRVRPDLPFACQGGVCGTCRAKVTSGSVNMRRNFALEESEVAAGFVLTCQSLPVSRSSPSITTPEEQPVTAPEAGGSACQWPWLRWMAPSGVMVASAP